MFLLLSFICIFSPPEKWEIAQPKHLAPCVQVGFVTKGSSDYHPSINLATEEVEDTNLKEYIKAVKKIHLAQPNTHWRDLGKFPMAAGIGRLTEISSQSPYGEIKMLQAILIKDQTAYILTGSVLRQDFPKFQNEILKSFKSMNLVTDLMTPIANSQERDRITKTFTSLGKFLPDVDVDSEKNKQWEIVKQIAQEQGSELGAHWQHLFLREGYSRIYE